MLARQGKSATQEGTGDDSSIDSDDVDRTPFVPEKGTNPLRDAVGNAKLHPVLKTKRVDHFPDHGVGPHHKDTHTQFDNTFASVEGDRRPSISRRRPSQARFANKVIGRLYNRRAFTAGLVFGRGHFLGDISKMVAGLVTSDDDSQVISVGDDSTVPRYGFGEEPDPSRCDESMNDIYEHGNAVQAFHSSTVAAGKDGCVVLVFPKASLIPFLDEYPGLLLSLLGTQVVV